MDFLTLIPALLFALTGLVAILILASAFIKSIAGDFNFSPLTRLRTRKLQRYANQLDQARLHFESREYQKVAEAINDSFFIDPPMINLQFLEQVHDHNFDVLAFILHVNQDLPGKLQALPELERLLQNRMQLMRSLAENYLSFDIMKNKRKAEGKQTPDWAISEFSKKIDGLKKDLETNKKETCAAVTLLCKAISNSSSEDKALTFH
jgi:hypothetical protein